MFIINYKERKKIKNSLFPCLVWESAGTR